jgi:hypothetical protein
MSFKVSKRQKFVITSTVLSFGFLATNILGILPRYGSILVLSFLTILLFSWSLREGLRRDMRFFVLILPFMFTVGVGLFWFLIPSSVFARVPVAIFYGLGIYALCLTANIYTVAAIRTIALLRAARGVGFVLSLVTAFLLYDAALSVKEDIFFTSLLIMVISFPIYYQGFWSINLNREFTQKELNMTIVSSLIMGEIAASLHFWPVSIVVGSLFLTITVYVLLGLGQTYLESRLFSQTIREYLALGIAVILGMFFATRWGG